MSKENPIKLIIKKASFEKRNFLMENESKTILKEIGVPFPKFIIAKNKNEAVKAAEKLGFPVVMKIVSEDIIHKSDCGGVMVNLTDVKSVEITFDKIINNVKKSVNNPKIQGIMIYKMVPKGLLELIIGVSYDNQFQHSILVGVGGIFVELIKDVSIRLIPISKTDAEEMLKELKTFPILAGFRSSKKADLESIIKVLTAISDLIVKNPNIREIDLNPIMIYEKGLSVVDARMIIKIK